jgi:hypothetical protein
MTRTLSFDRLRSILVATVTHLPDYRTGSNTIHAIADAALRAFAVFFVQSPSFLGDAGKLAPDHAQHQGHHSAGWPACGAPNSIS